MKYVDLLQHSYECELKYLDLDANKYVYLCQNIFEITTYDDELSEYFAKKALEICKAITNNETFKYIINDNDYNIYIIMCNLEFFKNKISWGTSIRGAFWDINKNRPVKINHGGLFWDNEQLKKPLIFYDKKEWVKFISALDEFIRK